VSAADPGLLGTTASAFMIATFRVTVAIPQSHGPLGDHSP
jgi:hypothetical protein